VGVLDICPLIVAPSCCQHHLLHPTASLTRKCQHFLKSWVLHTFHLAAASVFQRRWRCSKGVLLTALWIYDLHRLIPFSVQFLSGISE
jgi:hypothetical protein